MERKPLPVGIDSFRRLREGQYYLLIADWLEDGGTSNAHHPPPAVR